MTKNIMIIEDDRANMVLFRELLTYAGYTTSHVRDGAEALAAVRAQRPDLVVMDIQLPNVSGLDVTMAMKHDEALREIPVIAVTAFAMKGDKEKILAGGCDAYLTKPISIDQFLEKVKAYLD